ncbi:retinoic acid early transcript 1E [Tupaia chinensis]|nr:retinoic acid early transcript 1E [Tupaia chinensis]
MWMPTAATQLLSTMESASLPLALVIVYLSSLLLLTEARMTLGCEFPERPAEEGDVHSLCLNFTVQSQSRPEQPWCAVQGSVDREKFLQYDSDSDKARPVGVLGEEVNTTRAWTELTQTLGEVGRELRSLLSGITLEKKEPEGPLRLQAELLCRREAEQCAGASWQFSINGRTALLLDAMSMTWTILSPGARGIKEEWESDRGLAEYFRKISVGDCNHWLREFLELWETMLEPTVPPSKTPYTNQSSSTTLNAYVVPITIPCIVIVIIIIIITCSLAFGCSPGGVTEGEEQAGPLL